MYALLFFALQAHLLLCEINRVPSGALVSFKSCLFIWIRLILDRLNKIAWRFADLVLQSVDPHF